MIGSLIEASTPLTYTGYLLAFVAATAACLGAAWRARSVPSPETRQALTWFFSGSAVWAGAYVGFLLVGSALEKHLFYQLSLIVGFSVVFAWLWFCSAYSGRGLHRNRRVQQFAIAVYVIVTALKVTNPLHGLYYGLEPAGGGPTGGAFGLVVTHETLYWVVMAVAYALSAAGYLMIFEFLLEAEAKVLPLGVLTGLTALPAVFNVIGHVQPALLDITHEPLGVAVFAVGLLFAYETQFSVVQLTGSVGEPNLTIGREGRIRGLGGGIKETVPPLSEEDLGRPLTETLPGLGETIRRGEPAWRAGFEKGEAQECREDRAMTAPTQSDASVRPAEHCRYFRVIQTSLGQGMDTQTVVLSDITEQKHRERELRESERRFQAMLNDPNILAGVLAPDGTFQKVNDTALGYIEATRADVLGRPFWETPWWDTENRSAVREKVERVAEGEYVRFEAEHVTPDGEARTVTGIMRPVTGEEGEVVSIFVTARDITERKRKARRLKEAKEQAELSKLEAEEASRMKSAMLANMSHEIRTPLTGIIGFAEAIGDEIDGDGGVAHFADLIEDSGRRLLDTLDAVLNLSKLEAGQMTLESRPIDLADQAQQVAREFAAEADDSGLALEVEAEEAGARADEGGLQIVLQNLLSNAIKYTEEGTVQVRTYREDGEAVLQIEDTGIGMDPAVAESLFEPFRQGSEGLSREYEGTGIGLAVTKKATEQMGGSIDVETEKGEGSTFTSRLPAADRKAKRSATDPNEKKTGRSDRVGG
ncbi:PAS domain S-box-containing protein [Salinibacter ruber]|uniref:sensor histidine kinase n=1 Tax=Salinibacter ruber TaxID=146919 RepID=UPI0021697602|nr:ATP-binding protein [Salinibacter ruber]MCS3830615.1 PAS domain S-box-containing protein [Salinibacter ruber]MCS4056913.1 PAS domain S-box-containing protein [Salinibacter ruber]MCS4059888.1 PAS domain S-box-containing protein [Salinibacter ruber]MCS4160797.1 PAS domain S-box-containing protein [Salinibacter ruber]